MKWFIYNNLANYMIGISEGLFEFLDYSNSKLSIVIRSVALGVGIYLLKDYQFPLKFEALVIVVLFSISISSFKILVRNKEAKTLKEDKASLELTYLIPLANMVILGLNMLILVRYSFRIPWMYAFFSIIVCLYIIFVLARLDKRKKRTRSFRLKESLIVLSIVGCEWIYTLSFIILPESTLYTFILVELYEILCLWFSSNATAVDDHDDQSESRKMKFNSFLVLILIFIRICTTYVDFFLCLDTIALCFAPVADLLVYLTILELDLE